MQLCAIFSASSICTAVILKWSTDSGHLVKGINYPNEVNNESRKTNQKTIAASHGRCEAPRRVVRGRRGLAGAAARPSRRRAMGGARRGGGQNAHPPPPRRAG